MKKFFVEAGPSWLPVCVVAFSLFWVSCGDGWVLIQDVVEDVPSIPDDRNFSSPEGITVWNDRVFVTNANFAYQGSQLVYGTGFVTVIDRLDGSVVNIIPLPFKNPQDLFIHEDRLWALCSGVTAWDSENSIVVSQTSGGLAGVDLAQVDTASGPAASISITTEAGSLVGYPSGVVVIGTTAWVASGTTAALFMVDLESGEVVRGGDDPIFLAERTIQNTTVVGPGPDGNLTVGLFNDDSVFLFDPKAAAVVTEPWAPAAIGQQGMMDGILDIESDGERTYLLLGLANQVVDFDSAAGPVASVRKLATGLLTPNRMKVRDSVLYVVNSGDNSLVAIDVGTGDSRRFGLPVNCNPWDLDLAVRDGSIQVWISCLRSHSVVAVDMADGSLMEVE